MFLITGGFIFILQAIGSLMLFDPNDYKHELRAESLTVNISNDEESAKTDKVEVKISEVESADPDIPKDSSDVNSLGVRYGQSECGMNISEVVRVPAFYMIWFMYALTAILPGVLSAYYKTFGETYITNDRFLTTVGSVASIFNASGRIFWGFLSDKLPFKINMLILNTSLIALTATLYLTKFINSEAVFLIWISGIYFTFCGIYVVMPVITAKCFGQKNFTSIYGLVFTTGVSIII